MTAPHRQPWSPPASNLRDTHSGRRETLETPRSAGVVRLLLAVFWAGHGSCLGCSFLIRKTRAVLVQCFVTRAVCETP